MTWQWVALIAIIAFWTLCLQAIHSWAEVNKLRSYTALSPDQMQEIEEAAKK